MRRVVRGELERAFFPSPVIADLQSVEDSTFLKSRISYQSFMQDSDILDDPRLVVRYNLSCVISCGEADCSYCSRSSDNDLLKALSAYCHSANLPSQTSERPTSGSGWAWWRRKGQSDLKEPTSVSQPVSPPLAQTVSAPTVPPAAPTEVMETTQYAKTLRLSSDQLASFWSVTRH